MGKMDDIVDSMDSYFCDNLCKYRANDSLTQAELEDICAECKMGDYVCKVLEEHNELLSTVRALESSMLIPRRVVE